MGHLGCLLAKINDNHDIEVKMIGLSRDAIIDCLSAIIYSLYASDNEDIVLTSCELVMERLKKEKNHK